MSITIDIPRSNQILLPVKFLTDRDEEVTLIVNTLIPNPNNSVVGKRCFLHGPQGIGKTELCRVAAFDLRDHYSDAQVYRSEERRVGKEWTNQVKTNSLKQTQT